MTPLPSVIARSVATKQSSWIASCGFASFAMTSRGSKTRAFTLVELIVVMVLLLIVASMVAPRMSSFFRGRALSQEAQRLLSLTHYAQSRAVSEGVPVILWIDTAKATYGIDVQVCHEGADTTETTYTAEPTISLEVPVVTDAAASE